MLIHVPLEATICLVSEYYLPFYGNLTFITWSNTFRHVSLLCNISAQYTSSHSLVFQINFNVLFHLCLDSPKRAFPSGFPNCLL